MSGKLWPSPWFHIAPSCSPCVRLAAVCWDCSQGSPNSNQPFGRKTAVFHCRGTDPWYGIAWENSPYSSCLEFIKFVLPYLCQSGSTHFRSQEIAMDLGFSLAFHCCVSWSERTGAPMIFGERDECDSHSKPWLPWFRSAFVLLNLVTAVIVQQAWITIWITADVFGKGGIHQRDLVVPWFCSGGLRHQWCCTQ